MARWPALRGLTLWCSSAGTLEALTTAGLTGLKRLDVFLASEEPWSVPALSATLAGTLTELGIAPQPAGAPLCVPTHEGDSTPTTTLEDINVSLDISGTNVESLAPLRACAQLTELHMSDCGVESLAPLEGCVQLQDLWMARCAAVDELAPLWRTTLRKLDLRGTRAARGLGLSPWDVDNRSYSVRGWDSDEEEEGGEEEGQAGAQEGGLARVGCNAHGLRATRHLAAFESVRAACPNLQDMVATQIEALVRELEFENGDELVLKEALRQVTLMARYGAPSHSLGAAIARAGAIPRLVALVWDRDTPSLELVEAAAGALWALADSGVEVLAAFGPAAVAGILPQIAKLLGMSRGDMRGTVSASLIDIVDAIGGTEPGATT
ncbi:hypothetical protein FOA52_000049 [Chlamydomonas sp. UWO 241]|nr:hypothetical protein FOA52_000049 [Chlamydomonas sp. UWO 241]